ncbi:MAG: endolytic transglycosylase MltG [Desulfovibrio sp.]|jgi:cell division protein YceG involved in septum cleavage|nr:endolytic transglycosylase MltG [Desulfovibrio sp.]
MKKFIARLISCIFFLLLLAGAYAVHAAYTFLNTPASDTPHEFVLTIETGSGFDRVAYALKKEGAITDVDLFRLLGHFEDAFGKVRAGEYLISTGMTPPQVLYQITQGKALLHRLTIREGLTWWETAKLVEEEGLATFADFKDVIHDPEFLKAHNIPFRNAEGFLFPETYLMRKAVAGPDREQAYAVASRMVNTFWKKTENLWKGLPLKESTARSEARPAPAPEQAAAVQKSADSNPAPAPEQASAVPKSADSKQESAAPENTGPKQAETEQTDAGSTPRQQALPDAAAKTVEQDASSLPAPAVPGDVEENALRHMVILASMVERETRLEKERNLVAGVFANRLRLGMLLQCDPTIIYGIGENFSGAIRRAHIDDAKNIYNTYQHSGLPPGPICSSGLEALKAAAAPASHDFLFFVATGVDGGHSFSKTLGEHNRAVQLYRMRQGR